MNDQTTPPIWVPLLTGIFAGMSLGILIVIMAMAV